MGKAENMEEGQAEKEKSLLNEWETWMNLNNEEEVSLKETIMVHGSLQIAGLGWWKSILMKSIRMNEVIHASRSYDEMQFNFMMDPSEIIQLQLTRWIKWL
jgi:hypothetical protein